MYIVSWNKSKHYCSITFVLNYDHLSLNIVCLYTRPFWMCTAHDIRGGIYGSSWWSLWDPSTCGLCQAAQRLRKSTAECRLGFLYCFVAPSSEQGSYKHHYEYILSCTSGQLSMIAMYFCKGISWLIPLPFLFFCEDFGKRSHRQ